MDEIYLAYEKKYKKIQKLWKINNLTWNIVDQQLYVFDDDLPFGVFEIKIIGEIEKNKLKWVWNDKQNFIDKKIYPKGLKKGIKKYIGKDVFLNTIIALDFLDGIWYIHLHDGSIEKIAILTQIIKLYR
jgi:hypothetical protein